MANFRICKACDSGFLNPRDAGNSTDHVTAKEVYAREILIPVPRARYYSLDPNVMRHKDSLTSSDRRVNQAVDFVNHSAKGHISETKDSQQKVLDLYEDFKETEKKATQPKKPKAYLSANPADSCSSKYENLLHSGTTTLTYRNAMQCADLTNQEMTKRSVTASDFLPKVIYPLSHPPLMAPRSFEPECPEWMKYRRVFSQFVDSDVQRKKGYNKFTDDNEQVG